MATREIKEIICDVCKSVMHTNPSSEYRPTFVQVIFTTEQNEGRNIAPYLSAYNLDICPSCMKTILSGKMLFGHGAMGHNEYYFKE